jgi:alpha-L-arabinofuranosidase
VLRVELTSPTYTTARYGDVPVLDAVATHDPSSGAIAVFAVNRDTTEPIDLTVALGSFGRSMTVLEAWTVSDDDLTAQNTVDQPNRVVPRPTERASVGADDVLTATLPPASWTAVSLG